MRRAGSGARPGGTFSSVRTARGAWPATAPVALLPWGRPLRSRRPRRRRETESEAANPWRQALPSPPDRFMTVKSLIATLTQQEDINFLLTNRVPRAALTRFMGWFSKIGPPVIADH